jgi:hypothetical protein
MRKLAVMGFGFGVLIASVSAPAPATAACPYEPACLSWADRRKGNGKKNGGFLSPGAPYSPSPAGEGLTV